MTKETSKFDIPLPKPEPAPPSGERRSMSSRIVRASFAVMIAHVAFKLISPLQYVLISQFCDKVTSDLFIFGFEGVLGMLFLIGEESLGPAFLPVFIERMDEEGEDSAWDFANTILTVQFVLIVAAVALVMLTPDSIVALVTKWRKSGTDPTYRLLAPEYARYFVLGLFGMSLGSTTYMLLNGYKRFFLAAFGDAMLKLGIVAALATAWACHMDINGREGLWVFAFGVILGSALKLTTHLVGLRCELRNLRPRLSLSNPGIRRFLLLIAPLLFGILFSKVRDIYVNIRSLSDLDPGLISARAFGSKIYESIRFVIPYAVSIAMLPFFCEMVDRDEREKLGRTVTSGARLILLLCAPIAAMLVALSLPLARVLFQGGQGDFARCLLAATANACYAVVLPFAALETIFMQVFFANRRMISVVIFGFIFSSLSIGISYVGIEVLELKGAHAIAAVALAFTLSRTLKTLSLGAYMRSFIPVFPVIETLGYVTRLIIVTGSTGLTAWCVRMGYEAVVSIPQEGGRLVIFPRVAPELVVAGLAGCAVCFGLTRLLCQDELLLIKAWVMARVRRFRARRG